MLCEGCNRKTLFIVETTVDRVHLTATLLRECSRCGAISTTTERLLPSSKLLRPTISADIGTVTHEGDLVIIESKPRSAKPGQNAKLEAKWLLSGVGRNGDDLGSIRAMIVVPPEIEARLRRFAENHPGETWWIEESLNYRKRVLEEFDRLAGVATRDDQVQGVPPLPIQPL